MTNPILYCSVTGDRSKPALLLLHAVGGDRRMWDECAAIWSQRWCVLACDLRGAGLTPPTDRPWQPSDHVSDLEALRSALDLDRVLPIGCASGAFIAASYAAMHPDRVTGVVMSDATTHLGEHSRERVEKRLELVRAGGMAALIPAAIDLAFSGMPKDERYDRYTAQFAQHDPHGYAMLALGMLGADVVPALRSISVPSLVLVGRHDPIYPVAKAEEIHTLLAGSELRILEQASHFPPCQCPDEFARIVEEFATRRVGRA